MTLLLAIVATLVLAGVVAFVVIRSALDREAAAEKERMDAETRAAARARHVSIAEEFEVLERQTLSEKIRGALQRDRDRETKR